VSSHRRRWRRSTPRSHDLVYVAIKPGCQCVVDAVAIGFTTRFRMHTLVGQWLTRGWYVGRRRAREAALQLQQCAHDTPAPDVAQLELV